MLNFFTLLSLLLLLIIVIAIINIYIINAVKRKEKQRKGGFTNIIVCTCLYAYYLRILSMHIIFALTFIFEMLIFVCFKNLYVLECNNCIVNFYKNENKNSNKKMFTNFCNIVIATLI